MLNVGSWRIVTFKIHFSKFIWISIPSLLVVFKTLIFNYLHIFLNTWKIPEKWTCVNDKNIFSYFSPLKFYKNKPWKEFFFFWLSFWYSLVVLQNFQVVTWKPQWLLTTRTSSMGERLPAEKFSTTKNLRRHITAFLWGQKFFWPI